MRGSNLLGSIAAGLLAVIVASPGGAVEVRATVNIVASDILAIGGTFIAVGPAAPPVDFSGTDVAALGGANIFDQSSFMTNDCTVGVSTCEQVRIRIGGVIDIDSTPGVGIVAPKIEPQDVATFIFSATGSLRLRLDIDIPWTEDPLSPLAGAGLSRYSVGQWHVTGAGDFAFGPSFIAAGGDFGGGGVLSFDLEPGTYRLFSPSVSVFLCAESPGDTVCGITDVPVPASLALLASGLLGFFTCGARHAAPSALTSRRGSPRG